MASIQASPVTNPKTMSSRLLTMKFMQRAAVSSPSSPQTPDAYHSAKRQRLSNGTGSPVTSSVDASAIQAALAVKEAKHQAALDRQRAASQETKWVLSCIDEKKGQSPGEARVDVVSIGGASEPWAPTMVGRRSFGKFSRRPEKQQNLPNDTSSRQYDMSGEEVDESTESSGEIMEEEHATTDKTYTADREISKRSKLKRHAEKSRKERKPHNPGRIKRTNKPSQMSSISAGGARGRGMMNREGTIGRASRT